MFVTKKKLTCNSCLFLAKLKEHFSQKIHPEDVKIKNLNTSKPHSNIVSEGPCGAQKSQGTAQGLGNCKGKDYNSK